LESSSRWRRGTLSQVETGRLRPTPELLRFYDSTFQGHGLLVSLYTEARAVQTEDAVLHQHETKVEPGDAFEIVSCSVPAGAMVDPGAELKVQWVLRNAGVVPWRQRMLRRLGATSGVRLIESAPVVEVPAVDPGQEVSVDCVVKAPHRSGAVVAHWHIVRADLSACFPLAEVVSILLLVP